MDSDTIVAISTAPGRGGVGIVRVSGRDALAVSEPLLELRHPLKPGVARFAVVRDREGGRLDEAVVTYFAAPHSYTTEDVVEIAAHGSPVVLDSILRMVMAGGARLARPGEFTERAFLQGRLDLTQAEAVRDLIEAQTLAQARLAAEQMDGALSRRVQPAKRALVDLIAMLEAGIDFAEDDVDVMATAAIAERIERVNEQLQPIAASYAQGRLVRDGLTMAICGSPNAGKSSLFNRLVERERAIVTPVAGTTRDLVTETVSFAGVPVEVVDTAGLRETEDLAESMGIAKTREAVAAADLVLLVADVTLAHRDDEGFRLDAGDAVLLQSLPAETIVVLNKTDLLGWGEAGAVMVEGREGQAVSAKTTAGMAELRERILQKIRRGHGQMESGLLTTLRHHEAVAGAQAALGKALSVLEDSVPHEMLLLDLYAALEALDGLTGATTPDDILNHIFGTFCIGK